MRKILYVVLVLALVISGGKFVFAQELELRAVEVETTQAGDPDRAVITGQVPNETDGVEPDEIDYLDEDDDDDIPLQGIEPDEIDDKMSDDDELIEVTSHMDIDDGDDDNDTEDVDIIVQMFDEGQRMRSGGFVKLGDIKGESTNNGDEKGGKPRIQPVWKTEEGIMVDSRERRIGVTEHDASDRLMLGDDCDGICRAEQVTTFERLQEYVARTANTHESVREIQVSDEVIEMKGVLPFQLFGFIPLHITTTIEANMHPDAFGRVKVKLPWYRVFGRLAAQPDQLADDLEESINETETSTWEPSTETTGDDVPTETLSLNFEEIKAHIIDTLSRAFGQYNESDLEFLDR